MDEKEPVIAWRYELSRKYEKSPLVGNDVKVNATTADPHSGAPLIKKKRFVAPPPQGDYEKS